MRKLLKSSTTALLLICMTGNVWAATANPVGCANPEDMFAVRVAAVQQRLMVAAFSCHATDSYNKFVISYQKDLQASDRALQNFFLRLNDKTGIADYHSFKTRLANNSSIQSFRDANYCANAQTTFDAAFTNARRSLPVFLAGQTTAVDDAFSPCQQVLTASANKTPSP